METEGSSKLWLANWFINQNMNVSRRSFLEGGTHGAEVNSTSVCCDALRMVYWYHHRPHNRRLTCKTIGILTLDVLCFGSIRYIPLSPSQLDFRYPTSHEHRCRGLPSGRDSSGYVTFEYPR